MGLVSGGPALQRAGLLAPLPHGESGSELGLPRTAAGGRGVEAHTGHFHPGNLSRLRGTQRPPGTGCQSVCEDPLPEGGPRMYFPRLLVNMVPEDSSMVGFGVQNVCVGGTHSPPTHTVSQQSGLTCTQSQRQVLSSSSSELFGEYVCPGWGLSILVEPEPAQSSHGRISWVHPCSPQCPSHLRAAVPLRSRCSPPLRAAHPPASPLHLLALSSWQPLTWVCMCVCVWTLLLQPAFGTRESAGAGRGQEKQ